MELSALNTCEHILSMHVYSPYAFNFTCFMSVSSELRWRTLYLCISSNVS